MKKSPFSNFQFPISPGLFVRKECWTLSTRGKLCVFGLGLLLILLLRWEAYPFLAVNRPLDGDVLVVEGWIPLRLSRVLASEFARGHYRRLLVVCSSYDHGLVKNGKPEDLLSNMLVRHGVPRKSVDALFCPEVARNRTYQSALEARRWLAENEASLTSLNVVTVGPHARRSWLTYREAFGDTARVGIVALEDPSYDPEHWWRFTEGLEEVPWEIAAYGYAEIFFIWN